MWSPGALELEIFLDGGSGDRLVVHEQDRNVLGVSSLRAVVAVLLICRHSKADVFQLSVFNSC